MELSSKSVIVRLADVTWLDRVSSRGIDLRRKVSPTISEEPRLKGLSRAHHVRGLFSVIFVQGVNAVFAYGYHSSNDVDQKQLLRNKIIH